MQACLLSLCVYCVRRKEALWPYIREFSDNALTYVCTTMAKLAAAGEPCEVRHSYSSAVAQTCTGMA